MSDHTDDQGLDRIAERLRDERPSLTPLELDRMKTSVMRRVSGRPPRRSVLRARIAILAALVLGMSFSTAGAGLAITGFAEGGGQAATVQYDNDDKGGKVLGGQTGGDDSGGGGDVQGAQQVVVNSSGSGLPFTGFAAMPLLLLGVGLLTAGVVGRRVTRQR
jgi:hypothetical protein